MPKVINPDHIDWEFYKEHSDIEHKSTIHHFELTDSGHAIPVLWDTVESKPSEARGKGY